MHKKSLETFLFSTIGVAAMGLILIALNVITSPLRQRADLTKERAYTLSDGTRRILAKLDTPIKIRFYCTRGDVSSPYAVPLQNYARAVEDLLGEYKQAARGKLIIEKYDPQPDSDAEDSARLDGVEPQGLPGGERFCLGLAVSLFDSKEAIPFLSPERERQLEYDLSRAISRVITPEKPVVGVMSALPVFGTPANPMMMQTGQRGQEPWAFINELRADFTVKDVEMDAEKIDDDVKVLVVIHPRDITDKAQYAIDQYVLRGGKLIAFLDAQSLVDSRGQNPMFGAMPGGGSSLDKLLKAWGIQFDTAKSVADMKRVLPLGESGDTASMRPTWLRLVAESLNPEDIVAGQIDDVWMFSAGAFTGTPAAGLKETVLLKSTKESQLVDGMLASFSGESIVKEFKASGVEYPLAIRLTGKFKTAFPEGRPEEKKETPDAAGKTEPPPAEKQPDNSLKESKEDNTVILVGDADMIYDNFTLQRIPTPLGTFLKQLNANLNFAQNAVEQMAGDNNLIAVRSRATLNRPFTRIREMEAQAEARYLAKLKELQDGREEAMRRLNELQQQKDQNQRFILSPEQQAEIENLRRKEAEISRAIKQVQKDLRRDVVALQGKLQWMNIFAMPAIVSLTGIVLAVYKRKLTAAK